MVMGIPTCREKTRGNFFLFFLVRAESGGAPTPSPSLLRTPDATAFAITSPAVGLGSSGCVGKEIKEQCLHKC